MKRELLNRDGSPMRKYHSPLIEELLNEQEETMKAILEFNLPEDQIDFEDASNGQKWSLSMWELDNWLRSQTKHPPEGMSEDTWKALDDTREKLYEILNENGLKLR
jgi:hypothetical protein